MEQKKNNFKKLYNIIIKKLINQLMKKGKSQGAKLYINEYFYNIKSKKKLSLLFIYNHILLLNQTLQLIKKKNITLLTSLNKNKQLNLTIKKIKKLQDITKINIKKQTFYEEVEKNKYAIK